MTHAFISNATHELAATYRRGCLATSALSNDLIAVKEALEGVSLCLSFSVSVSVEGDR